MLRVVEAKNLFHHVCCRMALLGARRTGRHTHDPTGLLDVNLALSGTSNATSAARRQLHRSRDHAPVERAVPDDHECTSCTWTLKLLCRAEAARTNARNKSSPSGPSPDRSGCHCTPTQNARDVAHLLIRTINHMFFAIYISLLPKLVVLIQLR